MAGSSNKKKQNYSRKRGRPSVTPDEEKQKKRPNVRGKNKNDAKVDCETPSVLKSVKRRRLVDANNTPLSQTIRDNIDEDLRRTLQEVQGSQDILINSKNEAESSVVNIPKGKVEGENKDVSTAMSYNKDAK